SQRKRHARSIPGSGHHPARMDCLIWPNAGHCFSFEYFVGRNNEPRGDVKPKRFCRFEVESCLVLGGRLHREFGGLCAAQDTVKVGGGSSEQGALVGPIGYEAAVRHKKAEGIDRRQAMFLRKRENQIPMCYGRNIRRQKKASVRRSCK